ncbi:hypothetical protein AX16_003028 [Volvariella volvacea WC 439]|nr:hypothetical protein AX16_003028 [Volvariella volvacea WC 439]
MSGFRPPPSEYHHYVTDALEYNAVHNANHPYYVYADEKAPGGVSVITHAEFVNACHRAAYLVRPDLTSAQDEVVAVISHSDVIAYQAMLGGMVFAGLIPFPMSPRNSPAAIVNLLQKTNCHRILTTKSTLQALMDEVVAHLSANDPSFKLTIDESPSVLQIYPQLQEKSGGQPKARVRYPRRATPPDMRAPCIYLHSSGSTGFPKAIPWSHRILDLWSNMPAVRRYRQANPSTVVACMPLPPFHTLGLYVQLMTPIYSGAIMAVYPPTALQPGQLPLIASPENVLEHAQKTKSREIIILPSFIQAWAQSPELIEKLKAYDQIYFTGGALASKLGDLLVENDVRLHTMYGGTEFGAVTSLDFRSEADKDWSYMRFDDVVNIRLDPQGDGTYEAQILKGETQEPAIFNMPNDEGYATSDLFEPHPTKKGFYRIVARIDDVIIHSSGEKTVPAPMEDVITSNPMVQATILFGRAHDIIGALIELTSAYQVDPSDAAAIEDVKTKLWPTIEEANRQAPSFSRIYKEMVIFTPPDKPLPRAGKGTVMRKAALQLYDQEIKELYESVESTDAAQKVEPPTSWDTTGLTRWIVKQLEDLHPDDHYATSIDLFEQGIDSLDVTFLRQRIIGAFRQVNEERFAAAAGKITDNLVYAHPTIESLASYLCSLLSNQGGDVDAADGRKEIEDMIAKFSADLPAPPKVHTHLPEYAIVLLTGSTGNLGSHLLAQLVQDEHVAKVYALNRRGSTKPVARHEKRFQDHGLDLRLLNNEKVVYLEGDASQDYLGLGSVLYEELRNSVNVIVHNAWRLDFNLGLSSYQSNIRGTRNLIDLGLTSTHNSSLRFIFTSSISSAQSWDKYRGPFPEESLDDAGVAVGLGYGASKYVSERLLIQSGLQLCSLRIGQLSGGHPNGAWATTDWLPILVKSSTALGVLPSSPGVVSWLPMNTVATTIRDVIFSRKEPPKTINVVHPHPIPWDDVIGYINDALVDQGVVKPRLPVIPFEDWVDRLEQHAAAPTDEVFNAIPGIKLRDFYKAFASADYIHPNKDEAGSVTRFATEKAQAVSPAFKRSRVLEKQDAERWIRYWKSVGYFDK